MKKPFLTLDEQIQLLSFRGVRISDIDTAKHILLSENYFCVINGYKDFFLGAG